MSISIDDLVASLSSNHIGQEAIDLAALQAQLSQTLFGSSISTSSSGQQFPQGATYTQPCNTPTGRTPSSSFHWGQMSEMQQTPQRDDGDEMEDDERMVEDLLIPSSPASPNSAPTQYSLPHQYSPPSGSHSHMHSGSSFSGAQPNEPSPSLFTSTDPFYMAQLQATQNYSTAPRYFTETTCTSSQSPFLIQQQQAYQLQQRRENHGYIHPASPGLSLDTHSLFMATAALET